MTHDERQPPADLQRRIELLETALVHLQSPGSRARRWSSLLAHVLLVPLALTGWAVAQQAPAPAPGVAPPPAPGSGPNAVIRQVGAITQVTAPFHVVDGSGKVVLSVSNADDTSAGVAIHTGEGSGALSVHSANAHTVATVGASPAGSGMVVAHNSGGEAIADLSASASGRGSVNVFVKGQRVATLEAGVSGGGALSVWNAQRTGGVEAYGTDPESGAARILVFDNGSNEVAEMGAAADGRGVIAVHKGEEIAAVLSTNESGAGSLKLLNAEGGEGIVAAGSQDPLGGIIAVFNRAGEGVLGIGAGGDGNGGVAVFENEQPVAALLAEANGAGALVLNNLEGKPAIKATSQDEGAGASVSIFNNAGGTEPVISLESDPGQLRVFDAQGEAVKIGLGDLGGQVIVSKRGKPLAGLGTTSGGGGQVVVWNPGGTVPAAFMALSNDNSGGIVEVSNPTAGVASFAVSSQGAGLLTLTDASGRPTVAAGTMPNGNGRVQEGPNFNCAPGGAPMALALLDCIVGRQ